ncbi:MAG: hypothetical protein ABIH23_11990 [bacterium]
MTAYRPTKENRNEERDTILTICLVVGALALLAGAMFFTQPIEQGTQTAYACPVYTPTPTATPITYTVTIDEPEQNDVFLKGQEVKFESEVSPTPPPESTTYSWSVIQGTCSPSTGSSEDFITTFLSQGNIVVQLTVTINSTPYSDTRTVNAIVPEVIEVSFEQDHAIVKYPSGYLVTDPVWVKTFGGGVTKNDPAAYTKSGYAKARLKLQASQSLTNSTSTQVGGDGNTENFDAQNENMQSWPKVTTILQSSQLYQSVNFYDTLNVTWRYRVARLSGGWGDWVNMNTSTHKIYTTYSNPYGTPYDLALDKACHYAANQTGLPGIPSAICTGIKNDNAVCYDYTDKDDPPHHPLETYGEDGGSYCVDIAGLMMTLSHSVGPTAGPLYVWGGCTSTTRCLYKYGAAWTSMRAIQSAEDSTPANPHLVHHVEMTIGGVYYDACYGVTGVISVSETAPATDQHPTAAVRQFHSWSWSSEHQVDWTCPH